MFDNDPTAIDRLDAEPIVWLTTVRPNGQPQTSPVWFLRRGDEFLMYSLPDTARVRNIKANSQVALNLDGNGQGGAIVTLEGIAHIDETAPAAADVPEYVAKYEAHMERNGWTPEVFSSQYSTPIRITFSRGRAW